MYLIITKSFPPEKGGMQNLMGGLSENLSKYKMTKVITDYNENGYNYDQQFSFTIERVKGIKLLRKYRKALHANNFLKNNNNVSCVIADHWKSLELIKTDKKKVCLIHSKEINHDRGSRENKRSLKVLNEVDYVISNKVDDINSFIIINKYIQSDHCPVQISCSALTSVITYRERMF